jgi:hypothetical protein
LVTGGKGALGFGELEPAFLGGRPIVGASELVDLSHHLTSVFWELIGLDERLGLLEDSLEKVDPFGHDRRLHFDGEVQAGAIVSDLCLAAAGDGRAYE